MNLGSVSGCVRQASQEKSALSVWHLFQLIRVPSDGKTTLGFSFYNSADFYLCLDNLTICSPTIELITTDAHITVKQH